MAFIIMKSIATFPISVSSDPMFILGRVPNNLPSYTNAKKISRLRYLLWALFLGLWLAFLPRQVVLAQSEARSYTVVSGDTLFEIAQRFGITLDELSAYNGISDPNLLEVGQVLLTPPTTINTGT